MNYAQCVAPDGRVDPERTAAEPRAVRPEQPEVVVLEWDSKVRHLKVIYEGPLNVLHVKTLAAGRGAMSVE